MRGQHSTRPKAKSQNKQSSCCALYSESRHHPQRKGLPERGGYVSLSTATAYTIPYVLFPYPARKYLISLVRQSCHNSGMRCKNENRAIPDSCKRFKLTPVGSSPRRGGDHERFHQL